MPLTPCVSREISSKSTEVVLPMCMVTSLDLKKTPTKHHIKKHRVKTLKWSESYKTVRSKATAIQWEISEALYV